jgi:hypothetical protein
VFETWLTFPLTPTNPFKVLENLYNGKKTSGCVTLYSLAIYIKKYLKKAKEEL